MLSDYSLSEDYDSDPYYFDFDDTFRYNSVATTSGGTVGGQEGHEEEKVESNALGITSTANFGPPTEEEEKKSVTDEFEGDEEDYDPKVIEAGL